MRHWLVASSLCLLSCACSLAPTALLPPAHRLNGSETTRAFASAERGLRGLTARIHGGDGRFRVLGTVVDARGYLAAKASELPAASLSAEMPDGTRHAASLVGVDPENDLAVLRLAGPAAGAPVWAPDEPSEGQWVACLSQPRLRVGIVSTHARPIEKLGGVIGVSLAGRAPEGDGALIDEVFKDGPAQKNGVRVGDVIVQVNGQPVRHPEQLVRTISHYDPGMTVSLAIRRGGEVRSFSLQLGNRAVLDREDRNQRMSGRTSRRRGGFSRVFQHDSLVGPEDMGGPVVDVHGRLLGVNIARADRVTTYALPAALVRQTVGRFAGE